MDVRLVTVETGPLWKMQLLQGQLEEQVGIPSFIPDENTKRVDPFITGGGNVLDVELQVAEENVERTRAWLEHQKAVAEEPDKDTPPPHPTTEFAEESRLGRSVRWMTLTVVLAPVALVLGFVYILGLKPDEPRPRSHRYTVVAILFSILMTAGLVAFFWTL